MKIIIQELIKGNLTIYDYIDENDEAMCKQIANYIANAIPFNITYGD